MSDEEEVKRQTRAEGVAYLKAKRPSGQRKQKEGIYIFIAGEIGMVFIRKIFITHVNEFWVGEWDSHTEHVAKSCTIVRLEILE